jgi:hypothetical protein
MKSADQGRVAATSPTTFKHGHLLACLNEVGEHNAIFVAHDSAQGDGQHEFVTLPTRPQIPLAMGACTGLMVGVAFVGEQRRHRRIRAEDNSATPPA